jgi:hypothetical protein
MIDPCRSNEEGKIYVHNLIKLKTNVKMDLTGITDLKLEVKKPSGKEERWSCTRDKTCEPCQMICITDRNSFDEAGTYIFQANVEGTLGNSYKLKIYNKWE